MTKQEAKKKVCGYVMSILFAGQMEEIIHDFYRYTSDEQEKLTNALSELESELARRSH